MVMILLISKLFISILGLPGGRLSHPPSHTAAVLALNSGTDNNSPTHNDANIEAPAKDDDDDFWD